METPLVAIVTALATRLGEMIGGIPSGAIATPLETGFTEIFAGTRCEAIGTLLGTRHGKTTAVTRFVVTGTLLVIACIAMTEEIQFGVIRTRSETLLVGSSRAT